MVAGDVFMVGRFSKRVISLKPSPTLSMAEKANRLRREGKNIIKLDIGEPDFDTPQYIKDACIDALKSGYTHYTSSRGLLELREAIAEYYLKYFKVEVDAESEIIVTPGSKFAIYSVLQSIVDSGDEVVVLTPAWPTYISCITLFGGKPVEVPYYLNNSDEESIKSAISSRTKALMINSPNNPTGNVLSRDYFKLILDLAEDYDFYVISDEIYRLLVYDDFSPFTILSLVDSLDRVVVIDGFSKAYAMTGWRLGFTIASKQLINLLVRIQQNSVTCPAAFVQIAGVKALKGDQGPVERMVKEYDARRKFLVDALNSIKGVKCPRPGGAFYVFPDFSALNMNSMELAEMLLLKAGVCTVPGSVFGAGGEFHLRISYASSIENLREGVERIRTFIENL